MTSNEEKEKADVCVATLSVYPHIARVATHTSYSPEYITSSQKKMEKAGSTYYFHLRVICFEVLRTRFLISSGEKNAGLHTVWFYLLNVIQGV